MAITFNDQYYNAKGVAFYAAAGPTYTIRGAYGNVYNVDLFPDSGVAVGDAIIFSGDFNYSGKFNELRINLDLGVSAGTWDGVWEYCVGGTNAVPGWSALSVTADGTNKLRATGLQSLVFTVPSGWDNFHLTQVSQNIYYCFLIRFRITSVSGLTEGGHVANISNNLQTKAYTINCSNFTSGAPLTMAQIKAASVAGGWGVVTGTGNSYSFACNLDMKNSYFVSQDECVQFENNCFYFGSTSCQWMIGEIIAGDKVRKGSKFSFIGTNVNYPSSNYYFGGAGSQILNTTFQIISLGYSAGFNGYWGGIGLGDNTIIYDLYTEAFRQFAFSNVNNVIMGVRASGSVLGANYMEPPGAVIRNVTIAGGQYCVRPQSIVASLGNHIHQCDLSGPTAAPYNPYWSDSLAGGFYQYAVDCLWGNFGDTNKAYWTISPTPQGVNTDHKLWETYSLQANVVGSDGAAVSLANSLLKNTDGSTHFNLSTNPDGYIATDFGTATSGTTAVLNDTGKSWAANQYFYKEILITSGAGARQRRIVKRGGTSTQLPFAWACSIAPTSGSKYIILPYVNIKAISPIDLTPSTYRWSVVSVSNNPFLMVLRKYGKIFQNISMAVTGPVVTSYVMATNPFVVASEATASVYTGITINGATNTITLSQPHTLQELYDYTQWWAAQSANMQYVEPITTSDGQTFSSTYSLTIDTVALTGTGSLNLGTNTLTLTNGGSSTLNITAADGTHTTIALTGLAAGSRVQLYDATAAAELYNSVVAGTSLTIPAIWAADHSIRIRVMYVSGASAKKWYETTGLLTKNGMAQIVAQTDDPVYNTIGIDGSTVTECSIVGTSLVINVNDPDNTTQAQRLYAFEVYWLSTIGGIRDQSLFIDATDSTHFVFEGGLKIRNATLIPLQITGGNIVPVSGQATDVMDLTGGPIFLNFNRVEGFSYTTQGGLTQAEHDALLSARAEAALGRKLQGNLAIVSVGGDVVTIYDDDGTTPLRTFSISPDRSSRSPL